MDQDRRVAVIGLGYVGLPLAISFAEAGLSVEGIDAFAGRVAELNAGHSPIDDVPDTRLLAALAGGLRIVVPDEASIGDADAIFVCVPTPITTTKDPDLGPVLSAAETIRAHVRKGQLVILQSTTFPGTTTGQFRTVIEQSGLTAGVDFDLAFAPERVNPGDPASASKGVPRLVGATTPAGTASGRGAAAPHQRARRRDVLARRGRAEQAARERLPQRQHRVREPARAPVRADGARRLGGHQRGRDQAVRLHEVHARAGRRRALHPGGPVLPRVARA